MKRPWWLWSTKCRKNCSQIFIQHCTYVYCCSPVSQNPKRKREYIMDERKIQRLSKRNSLKRARVSENIADSIRTARSNVRSQISERNHRHSVGTKIRLPCFQRELTGTRLRFRLIARCSAWKACRSIFDVEIYLHSIIFGKAFSCPSFWRWSSTGQRVSWAEASSTSQQCVQA